jgi:hypothetical protein
MADFIEHDTLYERPHEFLFPRTKAQLEQNRAVVVADYGGEPSGGFTCDTCSFVARCKLAFDWYNINGDCLAEK